MSAETDRLQTGNLARSIRIPTGSVSLDGELAVPDNAEGLVIFAHGSGSSRFSSRNRAVAGALIAGGFSTLLLDLLTREKESIDSLTGQFRFDIERLSARVIAAVDWVARYPRTASLPIGCFGASTGAAAALMAAAARPRHVQAVISRGGRPDLDLR
jgi:dienelactone hydrolase